MVDLAVKLAGLRKQAGMAAMPGARPSIAPDTPVAPTVDPKVVQLRKLLDLRPAPMLLRPRNLDRELVGEEIAPGLLHVEQRYPQAVPDSMELPESGFAQIRTRDLLAFDTETTGLAGGTGTRAFMIGAADWIDDDLRVRQLYMTTLSAETAMLREFCRWIGEGTVLVSYNGKCYDRPLLSTRLRLARLDDPLLGRAHIDLLHPVRRRYRGVWPNCRLATAERELLGVCREDDLPGSEAPAAWLSYLRGGPARNLRRVACHNAQDLRSLTGLLRWLQASQIETVMDHMN